MPSIDLRKLAGTALTALIVLGSVAAPAVAQTAAAAATTPATEVTPVFTRARVASFHEETGGKFYVHLKLMPRSKIPFTTQSFRVADRALLSGIKEGASVKFTSKRVNGENTVTAIHTVAQCERFQKCE